MLQKESTGPSPEQMKRAFKPFSNWTDADAVHLAVGARGILMRHLGQDVARAVVQALQTEGVGVAIVAENDLPKVPDGRTPRRMELWPQALTVYDHLSRPTPIDWADVALVAAGAVRYFEIGNVFTKHVEIKFNPVTGAWKKSSEERSHKVNSDSKLLLNILLTDGATRYEIDAAQFPFKYVLDRPGLVTEEKFIWLVREVCRQAPHAILNTGARSLVDGQETVPPYKNHQALLDEMIWLLWRNAQDQRATAQ